MFLDEIENASEMKAALAKGDPELEREIELAVRKKVNDAYSNPTTEFEFELDFLKELAEKSMEHVPAIIDAFNDSEVDRILGMIPQNVVKEALRDELSRSIEVMFGRGNRAQRMFSFETGQGPGIRLQPEYMELGVRLDEPLSWVPAATMLGLLKEESYGAAWERLDEDSYSSGWIDSGDYWRLVVHPDVAYEWAVDLRTSYFSELVDAKPEEAITAFLKVLDVTSPDLAKKIKKAKLPKELLADYAVVFFEDPEQGLEVISEAMGDFGYQGSRGKTILELDEDVLRSIGITSGRWWSGAPWKLVDLPAAELAYEGTLMRHCVGRFDMGYRDAVLRGETRIWSLRSRFNKPVLTFEIDAHEWDATGPDAKALRGAAIDQIKGKLNRAAGRDPEEEKVLLWIFDQLGVDPSFVDDFGGISIPRAPNTGFDVPWRSYWERRNRRIKARLMPPR